MPNTRNNSSYADAVASGKQLSQDQIATSTRKLTKKKGKETDITNPNPSVATPSSTSSLEDTIAEDTSMEISPVKKKRKHPRPTDLLPPKKIPIPPNRSPLMFHQKLLPDPL